MKRSTYELMVGPFHAFMDRHNRSEEHELHSGRHTGSALQSTINHGIFQIEEEHAKKEALRVAKDLALAGYYTFRLCNMNGEELACIKVDTPAPVATIV